MTFPTYKENPVQAVLLTLVFLGLVAFLVSKTRNEWITSRYIGTAPEQKNVITVSADAKVPTSPDIARITVGLVSEATSVDVAQRENTNKMNAITSALREMGVEKKDLQTSGYSIEPKYDYSNNTARIVGYIINQQLEVTVRSLEKVGDILARVGERGANRIGGLQFTVEDPDALMAQARTKALEEAKQKAERIADALGVDLVRVVGYSESGPSVPMPKYSPVAQMRDAAPAAAPDIQEGTLDIVSNVSVTYEIR